MIDTLSSAVLAWLLTYLIHSTALLVLAWGITRVRLWSPGATDLFWKAALVGGLVSASVQLALEHRPAGSVSIASTARAPTPTPGANAARTEQAAQSVGEATASVEAASVAAPLAAPVPATSADPHPVRGIVVTVWALVGLGLALTYAARRLILVGRIGDRSAVLDGRLIAELERLTRDAGLRRRPRLTSTTRISSPIALGVAEICLPESALTELDLEQQRSMLAHELAHLARRDPIWLAFASLVERVMWIQPLNRLARRGIATSAEFLSDEWAVRRTGSGVALARCLAQVAEWIQASPLGVPVAGMAEERSLLVSRVEKLLAGRRSDSRPGRALTVAAIGVVVATIAMVPGVTGGSAQAAAVLGIPQDAQQGNDAPVARDTDHDVSVEHSAAAPQRSAADSTVVIALIGRLKDENAQVRAAAAHSLGKLQDPRAVPALLAAIGDRDAKVRAAAAEALGEFTDPRAVNGLYSLLADPELDVRKQALEALSEYESGVPVAGIVRLLSDPDADLRHTAVHALGRFGDRSVGAGLVPLVRDPSPDVRQAAIEAIANLHDGAHASAILPALSDGNADVRQQALEALGELRVSIPEATLMTLLHDANADVRAKAAEVAGERSIVAAIPSLRSMIDDPDGDVRENAVSALANIADDAAIAALRAGLASKDAKVRRAAAEALGDRRQ
jgi:HEAT repeat protein/beta-lactamase regulating signal transducer with metallopeptidase domain